jgi:hypothetical protein
LPSFLFRSKAENPAPKPAVLQVVPLTAPARHQN